MKLSILDQSPIISGHGAAQAIEETLKLARRADALGYHRYWLAEHHAIGALADPCPEFLLARLGEKTKRIRIGTGGVLLPYYSAFKVAEIFRMLEALYPGRIDLGIGRAPGGDQRTARNRAARGTVLLRHLRRHDEEAERRARVVDLRRLEMAYNLDTPVPTQEQAEKRVFNVEERAHIQSQRARLVHGSAQTCQRKLLALVEQFSADELMVITITGDYATQLESYERLAEAFELASATN